MKKLVLLFFLLFTNFLFSQQEEYKIMNTSVNSKYAELGVTYLNDSSIVFASSKKIKTDKSFVKNRRKKNRQLFLELYRGFIDENGDIIETSSFCNEINIRIFESDISFTPDSKKMYFTWNNYYTNQSTKISPKEQTLFIFSASFDENSNITNILPLSFNSKKYSVRNPEVSKDGEKLFFSSDMENGFGEFDIYVVDIFKNGSYSSPRNLGANINTTETELYPFIDENNVLYFSSYGHQNNGRFNIYRSELKNGIYQKPVKLSAPINSEFDDFAFVINNTTNSGFLTSNREDSKGGVDIYSFKIDCNQTITSLFVDDLGEKLNSVNVSLFHNANLIESNIVNGSIKFDLECNKTYKIIAEKENYISAEVELKTNNTNNFKISKTLVLTPIKCNQFITGTILENESEKMLNNVNVSLFHNADLIESNIVNGRFKFDLECNTTYKLVAEKENYISAEVELKTNNTNNFKISKTLVLTPIKCNQFITGTILENESEKMLNNVNVSLFHNTDLIESNIVNGSFTFDLECNTTYKLVAEKENYTSAEVELKTNNTNNFKIFKTLVLTPIKCNQFITGTILENESEKMLNNVNISLFHNADLIESNIVNGTFKFDLECNKTYKLIAEKENYTSAEVELKTNNTNNFKISKTLVLTPTKCTQFITGTISGNESEKMLNNVNISLFHNTDLIESNIVNGSFKFNLECNKTYKLIAEKENYISAKIELNTNNTNNLEITKTLILTPIECNQFITGEVLNKDTNLPLQNSIVTIFKENKLLDTLQLDSKARFKYNLTCNSTYKIKAIHENFREDINQIKTSTKNNFSVNKTLLLQPITEFVTVREQKMINTNPIYFDLDEDEIRLDAAIELEKVIIILYKYPTIKLEIKSHTDSRAQDNYNMELSNKRAQSTINYIVSKGISPNRVTGKGYGETQLLNKCSNGVNCSEAEHQLNRRTEFIVKDE